MYLSIKYKTLFPILALFFVVSFVIGVGVKFISSTQQDNDLMLGWMEENDRFRQIETQIDGILYPLIELEATSNNETKTGIGRETLDQVAKAQLELEHLAELKPLSQSEKQKLESLMPHVHSAIKYAKQFLTLGPSSPEQRTQLLKLIREPINSIHGLIRQWQQEDFKRIFDHKTPNRLSSGQIFILAITITGLFLLVVWLNYWQVVSPVMQLNRRVEDIDKGQRTQTTARERKDEIGDLSKNITQITDTLNKVSTRLNEIARIDELTKLPNSRVFEEVIAQQIKATDRYQLTLGVILFDLDHLKSVNDKHGRDIGDRVLQSVAQISKDKLRNCDLIFRFGGEEFIVLLPNTDKDECLFVAERIRKALLDTNIEAGNTRIKISASFGIAAFPQDGKNKNELIENAGVALDQAKNQGRNKSVFFDQQPLSS